MFCFGQLKDFFTETILHDQLLQESSRQSKKQHTPYLYTMLRNSVLFQSAAECPMTKNQTGVLTLQLECSQQVQHQRRTPAHVHSISRPTAQALIDSLILHKSPLQLATSDQTSRDTNQIALPNGPILQSAICLLYDSKLSAVLSKQPPLTTSSWEWQQTNGATRTQHLSKYHRHAHTHRLGWVQCTV